MQFPASPAPASLPQPRDAKNWVTQDSGSGRGTERIWGQRGYGGLNLVPQEAPPATVGPSPTRLVQHGCCRVCGHRERSLLSGSPQALWTPWGPLAQDPRRAARPRTQEQREQSVCLLFTNKSYSKMLSTHVYKVVDTPRKRTTARKQPIVTEMPRWQAHPWSALGKCLLRIAQGAPQKEPGLRDTAIENHKNIEHLFSNSHCKDRL